jgi:hypothetical protein
MLQRTSEKTPAVLAHTHVSYSTSPPTTTEATKQPQPPHTTTFFYSYEGNKLHRVNLLTGEQTKHEVPHYLFKFGCRWSELLGGSLLITGGGGYHGMRDVMKIDTLREYAASSRPPMHTARESHAAGYHFQYVYVLGGYDDKLLSECERYSCERVDGKCCLLCLYLALV